LISLNGIFLQISSNWSNDGVHIMCGVAVISTMLLQS
jgi:hypothetical protein